MKDLVERIEELEKKLEEVDEYNKKKNKELLTYINKLILRIKLLEQTG
jgi:hypothetical protein